MDYDDLGPSVTVNITYRNGSGERIKMPQLLASALALNPPPDVYSLSIDFMGALDNYIQSHVPYEPSNYYYYKHILKPNIGEN